MALHGKRHRELVAQLSGAWLREGPAVGVIEGFPGVGKTEIARELGRTVEDRPVVMAAFREDAADPIGDLLLDLSTELYDVAKDATLAEAVNRGESLDAALLRVLAKPVVIVVDELQRVLAPDTGKPTGVVRELVDRIAKRATPGRLLLLTHRVVERGRWSESIRFWSLGGLDAEDAEKLLDRLLTDAGRPEAVPADRRTDVVRWLAGNPRAIRLLVGGLGIDSLDYLVAREPEAWDARNREVSAELLEKLAGKLVERSLERLDAQALTFLRRLSTYRKGVQKEGLERVTPPEVKTQAVKEQLVERFLLDHDGKGWFTVNSIAREVSLHALEQDRSAYAVAHAAAAGYYTRHFLAKSITGRALGAHFLEARYHLVQAGHEVELATIAMLFGAHLAATLSRVSPIPTHPRELDERIGILSAYLADRGPKGLNYHLARLLWARGRAGDAQRALVHAQRGTGPGEPAASWVFRIVLEGEMEPLERLRSTIRQALGAVATKDDRGSIYQAGARAFEGKRQVEEAILLLREGIAESPVERSLFSLYQALSAIIGKKDGPEASMRILIEGIARIPKGIGNKYRLAESAIFNSMATRDVALLDAVLDEASRAGGLDQQIAWGQVARHQFLGNWREAAECAARSRVAFSTYFPLAVAEAFSWSCAGNPAEARAALERFPGVFRQERHDSIAWLTALIALNLGDKQAAHEALVTYLDRPLRPDEEPNMALLLDLWRASRDDLLGPTPSYIFPVLPPSLTGLPAPLLRHEPPPTPTQPTLSPTPAPRPAPLSILAVATEWDPRNGGLSTLNRNLCIALARGGHRLVCLVPKASPDEIDAADKLGVKLIEAKPMAGKDVGPLACLQGKPVLPEGFLPDVVIGHGRVTGFAAKKLVDDYFPKAQRVHFLHTVPSEIEWYKPRSTDAAVRAAGDEEAETELGKTAALAVGVGPRLAGELRSLLAPYPLPRPVHELDPGLDRLLDPSAADEGPRAPPPNMHCLFLGRAEDEALKGLDIAAAAIALVRQRGLPAVLVVRGAPPNTGQALQAALEAKVGALNAVRVKEFSASAETIRADLLRSSIVLMPSRSEGFGLVGLEAIERGVPALISDQSGLGMLLGRRELPAMAGRAVVPVMNDAGKTAEEWARQIEMVLRDLDAAFRRAAELRAVLAGVFTWERAAAALVEALRGA